MLRKKCSKCGEIKHFKMFSRDKSSKDGLYSMCKECKKKYYLQNKEGQNQNGKIYQIMNSEKISKRKKEWYQKNKDVIQKSYQKHKNNANRKEKAKKYREANKDVIKQKEKKYRETHKKELKETAKKYKKNNKDKILEYMKQYNKNKRSVDVSYKILMNLRSRICNALKNNMKSEATENLLGCSIDDFKLYFSSKFQLGMDWDLFLETDLIHIDHIIPCSKFDLSDPEQQKLCFHYTNLQPLWWWQNASKGNRETWISIGELFNESA